MPKTASSAKCKHPKIDVNRRCKDCKQVVDIREKRSKYGNRKVDGFDSVKELRRYQVLKSDPAVFNLQRQKEYSLEVNGVFICSYRCDFSYLRVGEDKVWREVIEDVKPTGKGFKKTSAYRLFVVKKRLMEALHKVDVVEV